MMLCENMVIKNINDNLKARIVFIDKNIGRCYFVKLNGDTAMPQFMYINEIEDLINEGNIIVVQDPYSKVVIEDKIPDKEKNIRDEKWKIIEYIWYENRTKFLNKKIRNEIITDASIKFNCNIQYVKRTVTYFFQRGMTKNALLSNYDNSGGAGKLRKSLNKKRGRTRSSEKNGEIIEGINIDEISLNVIKMSIKLFYLKKEKKSLAEAYRYMLRKFYSDKLILNGEERTLVWDKSRIPSYRQFVYWYHYFEGGKESIIKRESKKYYELHNRELLSNSTMGTFGPGSRYEIDATVGDVYLLSSVDHKKIIGRPVIYSVIDVFSRLVCGIYIGLEGPSWIGAMMALDNVVEDKVEFCSKYGIMITNEEWSNSFLPEKILADRGEFEGYNVENLINNLNIKIENTPPYRGDLKGIVERNFRTINEKIKHMTPGAIYKQYRERGDRHYALDAKLDTYDFTAIIIHEILNHNNSIINNYSTQIEMIKDDIKPIPNLIWNWGIQNRRCAFKYVEKDIVRLNLMYHKRVTITRKGIQFNTKLYYSCEEALKEEWYVKRINEKINIVYDPRNMNYIYIPISKGKSFIKCNLLEKCAKYKDLSFDEIRFLHELENEMIREYTNKQNQIDIDNIDAIEKIIKNAKERASLVSYDSDNKRLKGIRQNRAEEKKKIRSDEGFILDNVSNEINKEKYPQLAKEDNGYTSKMNLLKKVKGNKNGE
ncbi:Mu transposase C-terminal domain-containing protein [Clostridium botulinum]|uniref:Mu transposase C-terminal domain-containing protein n=1 Tax=Clostridium botulinum TaxID=1491 RepID=UPI0006A6A73D|nr:Mu transposase C-terminal domain-containing protein [Clostridium botulinum]KAI3349978.1 DDE-type integrase/transposase/recombinase [Clostridium botulinum]NFR81378.1 DDE-type integrase/transposase/recombinase [Clostridium botulinum]